MRHPDRLEIDRCPSAPTGIESADRDRGAADRVMLDRGYEISRRPAFARAQARGSAASLAPLVKISAVIPAERGRDPCRRAFSIAALAPRGPRRAGTKGWPSAPIAVDDRIARRRQRPGSSPHDRDRDANPSAGSLQLIARKGAIPI
jgi:hypothetical protein